MHSALTAIRDRSVALLRDSSSRTTINFVSLRGCQVLLEFTCGVVLARLMGVESYGVYVLIIAVVNILGVPAALGFDRFAIREIAVYRLHSQWSLVRGLLRRGSQLILICCAAIAAAALSPAFTVWTIETYDALALGMLIVPCVALARLRQAVLQGMGAGAMSQLPEALIQPLALLLLAILIGVGSRSVSDVQGLGMHAASALLAAIGGQLLIRNRVRSVLGAVTPEYRTAYWLRQAAPFMWIAAMSISMNNIDVLLVGHLMSADAAAIYRVASQVALLTTLPVTAVNLASASRIAELHTVKDSAGLQSLARRTAITTTLLGVGTAIVLVVAGPFVLRWYGAEFAAGTTALYILLCGQAANATMGVSGYILIMSGHERIAGIAFGIAVALQIVACSILIPRWGMEGAAIASAAVLACLSLTYSILVLRKHGVRSCVLAARSDT